MPLSIEVPGWASLRLVHLVLDVNGTLARDGALLPGVAARIAALRDGLEPHLLSADTYGQLDAVAAELGLQAAMLERGEPEPQQKAAYVRSLGADSVVAIGNGANDVAMLQAAALGIAVLGEEGLARAALDAADVVAGSIEGALDLLLFPTRLVATLRR
jgi:P-type E1-E2 ATPase